MRLVETLYFVSSARVLKRVQGTSQQRIRGVLLRYDAASQGICFSTFRKKLVQSSSMLYLCSTSVKVKVQYVVHSPTIALFIELGDV